MTHQYYLEIAEQKFHSIKAQNLFFWDLWCLNFVFEKIDPGIDDYVTLSRAYNFLWQVHDQNLSIETVTDNLFIKELIESIGDIYDNMDDFEVSGKAVQELLIVIESIVSNFSEDGILIYNAYEAPINVIDIAIGSISISSENADPMYLNEVQAQMKLADVLTKQIENYTFDDRNLFR